MKTKLFILLFPIIIFQNCKKDDDSNSPPIINSIDFEQKVYSIYDTISIIANAEDKNDDLLQYSWNCQNGEFISTSNKNEILWYANSDYNLNIINLDVSDGKLVTSDSITIEIIIPTYTITYISPENNTPIRELSVILEWETNSNVENTYNIYLGNNNEPALYKANYNQNFIEIGNLDPRKTYYWQIELINENNENSLGPVWSFSTVSAKMFKLGNTDVYYEMEWIPGGEFYMGAPGTIDAGSDESPKHLVTFDYGFWIGKYELNQEQWEAVMGDWDFAFSHDTALPAENISWSDSRMMINALNAHVEGDLWRLPSESEWEYAARGGVYDTRFWWGDDYDYAEAPQYCWIVNNSQNKTHNVGSTNAKTPNPYGLYDMEGNVWEWCEDWYHENYVGAPNDGSAFIEPVTEMRVFRGGAFDKTARQALPNLRSMYYPTTRYKTFGLRLVRTN